ENERRIAVVQASLPADGTQFVQFARAHVERLVLQDADVALFPATPSRLRAAYDHDAVVRGMSRVAVDTGVAVAFTVSEGAGGTGRRVMYLIGPRGIMLQHYQTHKPPGPRFESMPLGDEPCPVAHTHVGRVGLIIAAEGFVPEVARSLMLRGAELLLWSADTPGSALRVFARTRAEENRVYVACAAAASADGGALIVDPAGTVLAEALEGRTLAVAATMNRALTQIKARAPGTDVVRNRQPGAYAALTRQTVAETVL
ncbi:MAG TPA: carbon-nitrogen hydrolase family protein, partial [Dehalococcoidia bacterium]